MKRRSTFVRNEAEPNIVTALQRYTTNLVGAVRYDTLEGREHVVCPVVMLTEGVHTGSAGPVYYPKDELSKHVSNWDLRPITVYHPVIDGQGVSAANPVTLNTQKVGVLMESKFDGKLRSDSWIDVERANAVDTRIMDAVLNNKMMEVSTGLFIDAEKTEGKFGDQEYKLIARNFRPDHLALLPDRIGACSIAKGAGLLQLNEQLDTLKSLDPKKVEAVRKLVEEMLTANEMSFENIRSGLSSALRAKNGDSWDGWIESVYTSFVIYWQDAKLYRVGYAATDTKVDLSDDAPEAVVRVTEYRTEKDGSFVGNSLGDTKPPVKEHNVNKEQMVQALIVNSTNPWAETDRQFLMSLTVEQLGKLTANAQTTTTPAPAPTTTPAPAVNQQQGQQQPLTVDQYIANAPPVFRDVLKNGLTAFNAEKARLINVIKAAPGNVFSEDYLNTLELNPLQGIAALAGAAAQQQTPPGGVQMFIPNYAGQGLPVPQTLAENAHPEDDFLPPVVNDFSDRFAKAR